MAIDLAQDIGISGDRLGEIYEARGQVYDDITFYEESISDMTELRSPYFTECFTQDPVSTGWEWVNPAGDCIYKFGEEGYLQINVPPEHDLWHVAGRGNYKALRLLERHPAISSLRREYPAGQKAKSQVACLYGRMRAITSGLRHRSTPTGEIQSTTEQPNPASSFILVCIHLMGRKSGFDWSAREIGSLDT
jgi:hypothetical protein